MAVAGAIVMVGLGMSALKGREPDPTNNASSSAASAGSKAPTAVASAISPVSPPTAATVAVAQMAPSASSPPVQQGAPPSVATPHESETVTAPTATIVAPTAAAISRGPHAAPSSRRGGRHRRAERRTLGEAEWRDAARRRVGPGRGLARRPGEPRALRRGRPQESRRAREEGHRVGPRGRRRLAYPRGRPTSIRQRVRGARRLRELRDAGEDRERERVPRSRGQVRGATSRAGRARRRAGRRRGCSGRPRSTSRPRTRG